MNYAISRWNYLGIEPLLQYNHRIGDNLRESQNPYEQISSALDEGV